MVPYVRLMFRKWSRNAKAAPAQQQAAEALAHPDLADPSANEARVRRDFWPKLRRLAGRIPFVEELVAAYYCATDPQTPTRVKAVLFGGIAYFIMPFDFVPDIIAGLGYTDDAAVIAAILAALGQHVLPRHREAARKAISKLD